MKCSIFHSRQCLLHHYSNRIPITNQMIQHSCKYSKVQLQGGNNAFRVRSTRLGKRWFTSRGGLQFMHFHAAAEEDFDGDFADLNMEYLEQSNSSHVNGEYLRSLQHMGKGSSFHEMEPELRKHMDHLKVLDQEGKGKEVLNYIDNVQENAYLHLLWGRELVSHGKAEEAVHFFLQSMYGGLYDVADYLGYVFRNGLEDLKPDLGRAVEVLEFGMQNGNAACVRSLASIYQAKKYPFGTIEDARSILQTAVQNGDEKSEVFLASILFKMSSADPTNLPQAKRLLQRSVSRGDPFATYMYADFLFQGKYYQRDYDEAFVLFQKVKDNIYQAQTKIGLMHFHGYSVPKNEEIGLSILTKLASKGDTVASYHLGCIYAESGNNRNLTKAIQFWKQSRFDQAYYRLGCVYLNELKDYKNAMIYLLKCKHPKVNVHISKMYLEGLGVEKNKELGMEYLMKGVQMKNPRSMVIYGEILEFGLYGVAKDKRKATQLYKTAMFAKDKRGALHYARLLYFGNSFVEKNLEDALEIFSLFPDRLESKYFRGKALLDNNEDVEKAISLIKDAANSGYSYACAEIGSCYFSGQHKFPRDLSLAESYLQRAHFHGHYHQFTLGLLGQIYRHGKLKNPKKYFKFAKLGAKSGHVGSMYSYGMEILSQGLDDVEIAYQWIKKAADANYSHALIQAKYMESIGLGVAQNSKAINGLIKLCEDFPSGYKYMGFLYCTGICVQRDYKYAVDFFYKAGFQCMDSRLMIGFLNYYGMGVDKNPFVSYAYFRSVLHNDHPLISDIRKHVKNLENWMKANGFDEELKAWKKDSKFVNDAGIQNRIDRLSSLSYQFEPHRKLKNLNRYIYKLDLSKKM